MEKEEDDLEKLKIEEKLIFESSLEIMEKFNSIQRQLSEQVEQLVSIYSDASQKVYMHLEYLNMFIFGLWFLLLFIIT